MHSNLSTHRSNLGTRQRLGGTASLRRPHGRERKTGRPSDLAALATRLLDSHWLGCAGCGETVIPVLAAKGRDWLWACPNCGFPNGDSR